MNFLLPILVFWIGADWKRQWAAQKRRLPVLIALLAFLVGLTVYSFYTINQDMRRQDAEYQQLYDLPHYAHR